MNKNTELRREAKKSLRVEKKKIYMTLICSIATAGILPFQLME